MALWSRLLAVVWVVLLLIAAYLLIGLRSAYLALGCVGVACALALAVTGATASRFRSAHAEYRRQPRPDASSSRARPVQMGRIRDDDGRGFGFTRISVLADAVRLDVLGGAVGTYLIPISELKSVRTLPPSLANGMLSAVQWSQEHGPGFTFTPWMSDASDIAAALRKRRTDLRGDD